MKNTWTPHNTDFDIISYIIRITKFQLHKQSHCFGNVSLRYPLAWLRGNQGCLWCGCLGVQNWALTVSALVFTVWAGQFFYLRRCGKSIHVFTYSHSHIFIIHIFTYLHIHRGKAQREQAVMVMQSSDNPHPRSPLMPILFACVNLVLSIERVSEWVVIHVHIHSNWSDSTSAYTYIHLHIHTKWAMESNIRHWTTCKSRRYLWYLCRILNGILVMVPPTNKSTNTNGLTGLCTTPS